MLRVIFLAWLGSLVCMVWLVVSVMEEERMAKKHSEAKGHKEGKGDKDKSKGGKKK